MSTATPTIQAPVDHGPRRTGLTRALLHDCRGALLLETVIASMVFAIVGVAVLAGLSTVYTSGAKTEVQSEAENLARNQMEFVFSQVYREPEQEPYPTMTGIPTGYSVSTAVEFANPDAEFPDPEVEIITVSAGHEGDYFLALQTLRGRNDGLQLRYSHEEDLTGSARLHRGPIDTCSDPQEEGPCESWVINVFLHDPENCVEGPVSFYLNEGFLESVSSFPWAYEWDTEGVANDIYGIKAEVTLKPACSGETINVTAKFEISN